MYEYPVGSNRYERAVTDFKRQLLTKALTDHHGNRTHAARELGMQRTYFQRLIKELKIEVTPQ